MTVTVPPEVRKRHSIALSTIRTTLPNLSEAPGCQVTARRSSTARHGPSCGCMVSGFPSTTHGCRGQKDAGIFFFFFSSSSL